MSKESEKTASKTAQNDEFTIRVGDTERFDQLVIIDDPVPTGRQIVAKSGRRPEREFQLFFLTKDGDLEEIGLDETVDLRDPRLEQFLIFRSDRVFFFVINDRRFPWGEELIPESALKFLARVPSHYTVWLEREGGEAPLRIEPGSKAKLSGRGVEIFLTGILFEIQIDRIHYKVTSERMTGLQLRNLPNPPIGTDRDLFEVVPGGSDRKIGDDDIVEMKNGLRFFTAPGQINPGANRPF